MMCNIDISANMVWCIDIDISSNMVWYIDIDTLWPGQ